MDVFARFKEGLKKSISATIGRQEPSANLLMSVEASNDWEVLEIRLVELRTLNRKRQQETLQHMEPLARRIEGLLARAKDAKLSVVRRHLRRQAEGYMQELEAHDEPSKVYSANCRMLTDLIKQVQRARAMAERGVAAESIDGMAARLEEIVVMHEDAMDAAGDLEDAGRLGPEEIDVASSKRRLRTVYETDADGQASCAVKETTASEAGRVGAPTTISGPSADVEALEQKLYEG